MNIFQMIDQTPLPKRPPANYDHAVDMRPLEFVYQMVCQMLRISFIRLGTYAEQERDRRHILPVLTTWRQRADDALRRAEIHNFKVRVKAAMLGNALWRAHVKERLGGDKGLARWEAHFAASHARQGLPRRDFRYSRAALKALRTGKGRLPQRAPLVATDITACFRLAPLPRRARQRRKLTDKQAREQWEADALRKALHARLWAALSPQERHAFPVATAREMYHEGPTPEDTVFQIRPIPLRPEELRADPHDTARAASAVLDFSKRHRTVPDTYPPPLAPPAPAYPP